VPRPTVHVRPAVRADLPALMGLAEELRDALLPVADTGSRARGASRPSLEARYAEALDDPDRHLVVAVADDDEPVGMALFTVASANALLDLPVVHVSHAVVAGRHKRRGAGRALVAAAAAYADERGLDQIVVSVHPGSREANRFFARLGFAPLAVRRTAPVSVVRRRLGPGPGAAEPRAADHVVRRRPRRLVRQAGHALPLGASLEVDGSDL
jgi:ribosomal protein S18 acetylase RimI-like enzyme